MQHPNLMSVTIQQIKQTVIAQCHVRLGIYGCGGSGELVSNQMIIKENEK